MEKLIEIEKFLDKLGKTEKMVIVEGVKDKRALQLLGVKNVCCLNDAPLYKIVEKVAAANKKVVILTDLDREGRKLYGKLRTQLQSLGVEVDNYFREFLFKNTRIRQVEGLGRLCPANPCLAVIAESPVLVYFKDC
jgi:5S rRNA maturation endonuclease (ribonuclease M5)